LIPEDRESNPLLTVDEIELGAVAFLTTFEGNPNAIGPETFELDGQPAARIEMDLPTGFDEWNGRVLYVVALPPNSEDWMTITIGTLDKTVWDSLKPTAEAMLASFRWIR